MPRRVLVVDDDRSMVKTLADVLRMKGWEVATAYDGQTAVEMATQDGFDVVVMDVKMPGLDGVSAFKAMKAKKPDVRVVLMTAYAAQDLLLQAEREGVVQVMPKPVNIEVLLGLLTEGLTQSRPVLLIDTDIAFLHTLAQVLELRGFDTVVAESLDEALRLMGERRPAAILLHMHLGATNPRESVLAVHELSPAVALVLYSGRPEALEEASAVIPTEWIHAYLQKPFAVEQVIGVLDAVDDG
jgi:DNA-binding NtrC family response regulator